MKGLSHITLIVKDLSRTKSLFEEVLGAKEIYSSGSDTFSISKEKFFLIGETWLCIMEGDERPERSYNHIAFSVEDEEIGKLTEKLVLLGAEIKEDRPRVEGEGRSVYFYDYDNHLFELHSGSLRDRLSAYAKKLSKNAIS